MSDISVRRTQPGAWRLWWRWVGANSLAELVGLGGSALLMALIVQQMETVLGAIGLALLAIAAGTFLEGVLVGATQWWVLRRPFPTMPWQAWVRATAVGAGVAWTLGMLPSTIMALTADADAAATAAEPSDFFVYGMAALMGLVLGPVLALPQWWVLRRYVAGAGWWIPANALAWLVGMVIVFAGMGAIPAGGITVATALLLLAILATAGAAVGAVHGLFLLWLLSA